MKLIVGLGNPGSKYSETRHNAGSLVVEQIARSNSLRFSKKSKLKASFAIWKKLPEEVVLAYPEVFMNVSGESVKALADHFGVISEKDLLVVVDDIALPFGLLRLRAKGSAGGHNGLKSVETFLGSSNYARLRVGIGPGDAKNTGRPQGSIPLEEFVLMRFAASECKALPDFLDHAAQACREWLEKPIADAMNVVNH